jgi:glycosyltransferase involved in cell wall biosynthesis
VEALSESPGSAPAWTVASHREDLIETATRPQVIYVSYDGAAEPLGQSQVVAYLERLARVCDIELISFEKPSDEREAVGARLASAGVGWHPLGYHRRPPVASTAFDVWRGTRRIKELASRIEGPLIVHARSYVPALMALQAGLGQRARFLFDIRGFWADERVEGGIWRRQGPLYRLAKRYERRFFAEADAVVTLTRASVDQIRAWMGSNGATVDVIPTCVDVDSYAESTRGDRPARVVWAGTVGGWYDFATGVALARQIGLPLRVLTRQVDEARNALDGLAAEVKSIPAGRMPEELSPGDVGLCTVRPSFSKLASAPTRVAEYLAAGMPLAVLTGVGDLDELVAAERVGVSLSESDPSSIEAAAEELRSLSADPATPARCREVARRWFSLEHGVESYLALYRRLVER